MTFSLLRSYFLVESNFELAQQLISEPTDYNESMRIIQFEETIGDLFGLRYCYLYKNIINKIFPSSGTVVGGII